VRRSHVSLFARWLADPVNGQLNDAGQPVTSPGQVTRQYMRAYFAAAMDA
jgi:hypothetical protein